MSAADVAGAWALVENLTDCERDRCPWRPHVDWRPIRPGERDHSPSHQRRCCGAGCSASTPATLRTAAKADFNGDFKADLVWRDNDGTFSLWTMNGIAALEGCYFSLAWSHRLRLRHRRPRRRWQAGDHLARRAEDGSGLVGERGRCAASVLLNPSEISTTWKIVAVGDMNRDAKADLIWQHDQGWLSVWYMNGLNAISSSFSALPTGFPTATGRFSGAGCVRRRREADLIWPRDLWVNYAVALADERRHGDQCRFLTPNQDSGPRLEDSRRYRPRWQRSDQSRLAAREQGMAVGMAHERHAGNELPFTIT